MELSTKRSLEGLLETRHEGGGILGIEECMRLAQGLGEALAYLHEQKIVHRDLKPDNLLVDEAFDVTLMDFGLVKDFDRSEMTAEGMVMGTPRYMAPEQTQGQPVAAAADVYQVGLILYRALTGRLPLEDENPFATALRRMQEAIPPPSRERPGIPPGLDRILLKSLRYKSEERYADMGAFLVDLAKLDPRSGNLKPGESMPGSLAERSVPRSPRSQEGTVITGTKDLAKLARGGSTDPDGRRSMPSSQITRATGRPGHGAGGAVKLVAALVGAVAAAGGIFMVTGGTGGAAGAPRVSELRVALAGDKATVSFRTSRPVRSFLKLDPPNGNQYKVMGEASTMHAATIEELIEEDADTYQLVLETPDGQIYALEPAMVGDTSGGAGAEGLGITEDVQGDRATIEMRTEEPATATLLYGPGNARTNTATVLITGERTHVFQLRGLEAGTIYTYEIELTTDAGTRRSGAQTLRP
jgi:hypothetical protein